MDIPGPRGDQCLGPVSNLGSGGLSLTGDPVWLKERLISSPRPKIM